MCIINSQSFLAGDHDRKKRQAIFTLDVHPDGTRLATGGIDAIIRIWTTTPILHNKFELNSNVPKQLSTLDQHSGIFSYIIRYIYNYISFYI